MYFSITATSTTEIYTLSLHDALPIFLADHGHPAARHHSAVQRGAGDDQVVLELGVQRIALVQHQGRLLRSEEHTSELQSRQYLVCRLLLEKKKIKQRPPGHVRRHVPQ